jgi:hypothetical protein
MANGKNIIGSRYWQLLILLMFIYIMSPAKDIAHKPN